MLTYTCLCRIFLEVMVLALSLFYEYQTKSGKNGFMEKATMGELTNALIPPADCRKPDLIEERKFGKLNQAQEFFAAAAQRLLDVNDWGRIAGLLGFKVFNPDGEEARRPAVMGDFIRIDIPGPGPIAGGGFDWVKIEEIDVQHNRDQEIIGMRYRIAGVKPF